MHSLKKIKKIILVALVMYMPLQSIAWGVEGHRIVGEIADSYLTKKAKREIKDILGYESVAMSSNWGDFIKSDPAYGFLYNWHFINLKSGLTTEDILSYLEKDTTTDVYTKINYCTAQLKDKSLAADKKVLYLRMLIHITGDVHQPLHIGRPEDKGGNTIKILWFGNSFNLHQVWDEKLIDFQQLSYTEYAAAINHTTKEQRKEWQKEPVSQWITDGYKITEKIYADITMPDQKLDYKYNFNYLAILNQQLLKGGVHLAGLLNNIFG